MPDAMPVSSRLGDVIARLANEFSVEIAVTPDAVREALQIRHDVYCVERGWEDSNGDEESDRFDTHAFHAVLREVATGDAFGTVRLVYPDPASQGGSLPLQRIASPNLLMHFPLRSTGEISRFAISKRRREVSSAALLPRLALMRGIVHISDALSLTHWCALMEPALLRLLRSSGIYFEPIGPSVSHHGLREPSAGSIPGILARLRREQFPVWNYITAHGTLCRPAAAVASRPIAPLAVPTG